MIPFGHIAGIPVEETLLSVAPIGAVGIGAVACAAGGACAGFWACAGAGRPISSSPTR